MPFQDPNNWVGTTPKMQTPTTPSTVVAHKDSSWFTSPLSGICSTVTYTSLLSSQAGAQFCGDWTVGQFLLIDWHFVHLLRRTVPWFINDIGGLVSPSSLLCHHPSSPGQLCRRMQDWTILSWPHQQAIHLHSTCWDYGNGSEKKTHGWEGSNVRIMCNILFF